MKITDFPAERFHLEKEKNGIAKGQHRKKKDENSHIIHAKTGVKPGTIRGEFNKDGSPRKKPGVTRHILLYVF